MTSDSPTQVDNAVVVTGVSRGIGRTIAEHLSLGGQRVIGTYNTGRDEDTRASAEFGIEVVQVDLSDRSQTERFATDLLSRCQVSGLVNNAGVIEFEVFDDFTMSAWDRTMEINVNAPLILSQSFGRAMGPGGAIINIASTDANVGSYSSIAYSASKAALISVTRSLACVLGDKGVRVVAVTPGWIDTGMSTEESYEAASLTPVGRNGLPSDVAALVKFLLSDQAAFISGSSFVVDGGYTCVDYIMKKENDALSQH